MVEKRELIDEPDYPLTLDKENFDEAVKKYSNLVVDFWAIWCMPCHMIAPAIENLAKKYKGKVVFGKVNVDEEPEIPGRFGIMSIPTLIIFKNGEKAGEIVGAMPEGILEEKIKDALGI